MLSATSSGMSMDLSSNDRRTIFFCRSFIVSAEIDGVLSYSFENCTFALYYFGSDLSGVSSGFWGWGGGT